MARTSVNDVITLFNSHDPSHRLLHFTMRNTNITARFSLHGGIFPHRTDILTSVCPRGLNPCASSSTPAEHAFWRGQPPVHYARVHTPITIANSFAIIVRFYRTIFREQGNCPVSLLSSP